MMYDTMQKLPPRGSMKESLMTSIRLRRDVQDLYRTYVIVQAIRDKGESGEPTQDAFNNFRQAVMPYVGENTKKSDQDVIDRLHEEVARGPLRVKKTIETPKIRSRLQKIARKTANMGM